MGGAAHTAIVPQERAVAPEAVATRGVVILAATSAIARAIANELAARGYALILAARDMEDAEAIAQDLRVRQEAVVYAMQWDAADFDSHAAFVDSCVDRFGGELEGVVMVSGFQEDQKRAESDWAASKRSIDVNLTGAVSVLNQFANRLEGQGHGFIVGISSVAGDRGRQSNYLYGAAKAGFTTYLEGLRNRLYHVGVHVLTVKPGFVDTKATYGEVPFAADPKDVGRAIVLALERRRNVIYVPWFWRYIMLIIRLVPETVFKRLKM
ncbi:MAG: SDR family oxidoreductase [Candidatus Hydrogenedentales bacterium]